MKSDILQETLGTILKNIEKDGIQKIVFVLNFAKYKWYEVL